MIRKKAISNRLLLGTIFFGLNVLCVLWLSLGHGGVRHTRVNYSHIPAHSSRRAGSSRSDSESVATDVAAHFDHSTIDHTPQATLSHAPGTHHVQPVAMSVSSVALHQDERTEPLAEVSIIALGSAPRAPGLGRAPPIAA